MRTSGLPEGLYDIDLTVDPDARGTHATSMHPLLGGPVAVPRRSRSPSPSDSESYIHKRWLRGVSYGSDRPVVPIVRRTRVRMTTACILFWIGFIAPWCWLIGGWMLLDGEMRTEGGRSDTVLPLWMRRGRKRSGLQDRDKKKLLALKLSYPLVAPSVESLSPSVHSRTSATSAPKIRRELRRFDPWVIRCRIAAITSGVLLLAVCIVALIVVCSRS